MSKKKPLIERFWEVVNKSPGLGPQGTCWEWTAGRVGFGYGGVKRNGKTTVAHRIAWEMESQRSVPVGMKVLHRCDNPPCVNPAHLFLGTMKDNAVDMTAKGRNYIPTVHKTKLDAHEVIQIRRLAVDGISFKKIARKFDVSDRNVSKIVKRQTRADIP